jgi:hypothetical protein
VELVTVFLVSIIFGCMGGWYFRGRWQRHTKVGTPSASHNSAMPKCPVPVPCKAVLPGRVCGKVPKCFSRYGTSA